MTYRAMENPPGWRLGRSGRVECDNCICAWHCYAEEGHAAAAGRVSVMSTAAPGAMVNWFSADDYGELWSGGMAWWGRYVDGGGAGNRDSGNDGLVG